MKALFRKFRFSKSNPKHKAIVRQLAKTESIYSIAKSAGVDWHTIKRLTTSSGSHSRKVTRKKINGITRINLKQRNIGLYGGVCA